MMKNIRSGTPRARRCSLELSVDPGRGVMLGSAVDISSPPSGPGRARTNPYKEPEDLRGLDDGAQRDALVDVVDLLPPRPEAHGGYPHAYEMARIRRGRRR